MSLIEKSLALCGNPWRNKGPESFSLALVWNATLVGLCWAHQHRQWSVQFLCRAASCYLNTGLLTTLPLLPLPPMVDSEERGAHGYTFSTVYTLIEPPLCLAIVPEPQGVLPVLTRTKNSYPVLPAMRRFANLLRYSCVLFCVLILQLGC